jgi:hypothetical protein
MNLSLAAQRIQHHPRLHPGESLLYVQLENAIHVLGEVEYDSRIATLPGQAGACAPSQNRRAVFSADCNRGDYIVGIAWNHQSYWNLAIVGAVGRVHGPATPIETNLALDALL